MLEIDTVAFMRQECVTNSDRAFENTMKEAIWSQRPHLLKLPKRRHHHNT